MKANRIHRFGAPDVICYEDVERPVPAAGEAVVRVMAAGVGPWDGWIRAGKSVLPQPLPLTLGSDLSGIVADIGPGVSGFGPGDEVFGVTNPRFVGAYAEYAVATAGMIAHKPRRLDHVQAASLPVVAVTAWQMLHDHAGLRSGQRVLVHGAAGSVGACAVQLAARAGADVIATVAAKDAERVARLGAQQVVDIGTSRFEDVVPPVDIVIDLIGGDVQARSLSIIKPGGVLVSAVSQPDQQLLEGRQIRAGFMLVRVDTACLEQIAQLIEAGELATHVGAVLPLAQASQAHEMLEGILPRPGGKIVLEVDA